MKRLLGRIKGIFFKKIRHYDHVPPFYGIAWEDNTGEICVDIVCMPMPLNIIAAILYNILSAIKCSSVAIYSNPRCAYLQGIKEGERRARERRQY